MCLRKICNVKNFVSVFLMILMVGTSLFGAKKHEVKKDLHPCKTKSIKPQPEEKVIKLDPVVDEKLIEKKEKEKTNETYSSENNGFVRIGFLICGWTQAALNSMKNIDVSTFFSSVFHDDDATGSFMLKKSLVSLELFKTFALSQFLSENAKDIAIGSMENDYYTVSWKSVKNWTDLVNLEKADDCSHLCYTYADDCLDRESLNEMKGLLQEHYKIHITPKDETEGLQVVMLLFGLMKNNDDFRKNVSSYKFLKSFVPTGRFKDEKMPVFVVYPVWGKTNSQVALNILFEALKKIHFVGGSYIPRFNCTLRQQGLFFAMGEGYLKRRGDGKKFFDKKENYGICSKKYFKSHKDYMLTLSEEKEEKK